MLFNSLEFAIFLPIVFVLYWFVANKSLRLQNLLIFVSSYFFYGWWDWRFLSLIAFSSLLDYWIGLNLGKTENPIRRKILLFCSIFVNIGFLAFFKYFNFFAENFCAAFTLLGKPISNSFSLKIILPVGISFYTFQTLSYSIDVYRKKLAPTNDLISFLAYVSFFPQLVAGPIERATNLLPQFYVQRIFKPVEVSDGLRQMLWGLFKKMVIADNCASYANEIFSKSYGVSGSTLLIGAVFFSMQIYGDFSGYSDIAIGTSRLFGFDLMRNFAYPYFSRDIAEFWRRWHISLSSWFRDYVYIPLGGSKMGLGKSIRNTLVIFIASGFWHGANWTFIFWGFLNALYFLPLLLMGKNRVNTDIVAQGSYCPSLKELCQMLMTYSMTLIAWIFFRSNSVSEAFGFIFAIFDQSLFSVPEVFPKKTIILLIFFLMTEWIQREKKHALEFNNDHFPRIVRWGVYYLIALITISFGGAQQQFIYFQF
jgi:D-alanyl-lipoteichoic acid acyltransferase DltB (MBOAT superfamily)